MARRTGILALIAGLAVLAFLATRRDGPDEQGALVVHVHVVDADGKPVVGAQVRPRFTQEGWENVDGAGSITLRDLPLHAGHEPSATSLGAAISIRARFLGVRSEPAVRNEDGAWHATFTLAPHGVIRLSIAQTHLAPLKAWIEPDPQGRFEAMGGRNVARLDLPAAFRVRPGLKELVVHVEGEPDPVGVIRAASQRLVFEAPTPGVVKQAVVYAEEALPITGEARMASSDGGSDSITDDRAEVVVRTIENDAPARELGRVAAKKGRFLIPFTARGPYALTLHVPLRAPGPMKVAAGGTEVMLFAGRVLPWLRLKHRELDPERQRLSVRVERTDGKPVRGTGTMRRERTWSQLAFAEPPGEVRVEASVPGTHQSPPLGSTRTVDVARAGEHELSLQLEPAPFATVAFRVTPAPDAFASVRLGKRKTTLVPLRDRPVLLKHVSLGKDVPLVVHWSKAEPGKPDRAAHFATVQVSGDEVSVDVPCLEGGFVSFEGHQGSKPTLTWNAGQSPYGDAAGSVRMRWADDRWTSEHALKPGAYTAAIEGVTVTFTIVAGETTPAERR